MSRLCLWKPAASLKSQPLLLVSGTWPLIYEDSLRDTSSYNSHCAQNSNRQRSPPTTGVNRCPVSLKRIHTAVRGESCTHAQCFDRATFEQLRSTTSCPICRKPISRLVADHATQHALGDQRTCLSVLQWYVNRACRYYTG